MNDTPEPNAPDEPVPPTAPISPPPFRRGDEPANARTAPMPAVRRPDFGEDVRPLPAPGRATRAVSTPRLVVVGVLALLLLAAGVYVLVSDRSPGTGAGSSTSTAPTSADATSGEDGTTDESFSEQAPTSAEESIGLPTKPDTKKQPGKGACKAATTPKKSGNTLVQNVVITCPEPTSLTIETVGKSVVTRDGEKHSGTVEICAAEVEFTVTGGAYKWSADGPCEP